MRSARTENDRGRALTSAARVERSALQQLLGQVGHLGEVLGLLREALAGDGTAKVYALMPPGLRVR